MYLYTSGVNLRTQQFTYYILEGTLHHTILLDYLPSQLAAAALFLARHTYGADPWNRKLATFSKYNRHDLVGVARSVLFEKFFMSPHITQLESKYSSSEYGSVSGTNIPGGFYTVFDAPASKTPLQFRK